MRAKPEEKAIAAIERHGALLVYPMTNRAEPKSLWSELHPRVPMRWAWDEGADDRVVALWHLRERLARSRKVVYTKWFKGRAVFFSRELFAGMLAELRGTGALTTELSREAREILDLLEENSPISSKELRKRAALQGRLLERTWTRAMNELWSRCLVVGTGEVADGAFPSLAVGATRWIFEELWNAAEQPPKGEQRALIATHLHDSSPFGKEHKKTLAHLQALAPDLAS